MELRLFPLASVIKTISVECKVTDSYYLLSQALDVNRLGCPGKSESFSKQ